MNLKDPEVKPSKANKGGSCKPLKVHHLLGPLVIFYKFTSLRAFAILLELVRLRVFINKSIQVTANTTGKIGLKIPHKFM